MEADTKSMIWIIQQPQHCCWGQLSLTFETGSKILSKFEWLEMQQLFVGGKKIKLNLKENKQKIQIKKKKKENQQNQSHQKYKSMCENVYNTYERF